MPLLGPSTTEAWQVQIHSAGTPVGSLRAVLNIHQADRPESAYSHCFGGDLVYEEADEFLLPDEEELDDLRLRLSAHGGFYALAADQLLDNAALGVREFGSLSMLVFDQLSLTA